MNRQTNRQTDIWTGSSKQADRQLTDSQAQTDSVTTRQELMDRKAVSKADRHKFRHIQFPIF